MKRLESFRFYLNDWLTSTVRKRCSLEARGLYVDILVLLYGSPVPGHAVEEVGDAVVPLTPEQILTDAGSPGRLDLWDELVKWGALKNCAVGWYNPKAVDVGQNETEFRATLSERSKKANAARWHGARNPTGIPVGVPVGAAKESPPVPVPDPVPDPEPAPAKEVHPPSSCTTYTLAPTGAAASPLHRAERLSFKKVEAWGQDPVVKELFEVWRSVNDCAKRAKYTQERILSVHKMLHLEPEPFTRLDLAQSIIGWGLKEYDDARFDNLMSRDLSKILEDAKRVEAGLELWRDSDRRKRVRFLPVDLHLDTVQKWTDAHDTELLPHLLSPHLTPGDYQNAYFHRGSVAHRAMRGFIVAALCNGTDEHRKALAAQWRDPAGEVPMTDPELVPESVRDRIVGWTATAAAVQP